MEIINATLMWAAVVALAVTARRRTDHSTLLSATAIAFSLTFNVSAVYLPLDRVLGGRNLLDLLSNALLVGGIYFLSRAALRAVHGPKFSSPVLRIGLGVTLVAVVVTFFMIEQDRSSTTFMLDFGSQVPAALYSSIQFTYVGVVMAFTAVTCLRYRPSMSSPGFRIGFAVIAAGCFAAIALVVVILTMNALNLVGSNYLASVRQLYTPLYVLAIFLLCVGYATPPLYRMLERLRRERQGRRAYRALLATRAALVGPSAERVPAYSAAELHRLTVTVLDFLAANPEARPTAEDNAALAEAERFLARPTVSEPQRAR